MSKQTIADELREAVNTHTNQELYAVIEADTLLEIADHIDEEYDRVIGDLADTLYRQERELRHLQDGYGSMSREHTQAIVELSNTYNTIDRLKRVNDELRHQRDLLYRERP